MQCRVRPASTRDADTHDAASRFFYWHEDHEDLRDLITGFCWHLHVGTARPRFLCGDFMHTEVEPVSRPWPWKLVDFIINFILTQEAYSQCTLCVSTKQWWHVWLIRPPITSNYDTNSNPVIKLIIIVSNYDEIRTTSNRHCQLFVWKMQGRRNQHPCYTGCICKDYLWCEIYCEMLACICCSRPMR